MYTMFSGGLPEFFLPATFIPRFPSGLGCGSSTYCLKVNGRRENWLFLRRFDSILNLKIFQLGLACKHKLIIKKGLEELRGVKYRQLN